MIDLSIPDSNTSMMKLNRQLIAQKKINTLTIEKIKNLHFLKQKNVQKMEKTENPQLLYLLGQIITTIEFKLQSLWGFDLDVSWHPFYELPKCKCPKLDNFDRKGVKNSRIISEKCPVHFKQ